MSEELIVLSFFVVLIASWKLFCHAAGTMSLLKLNMISYNYYVQLIIYSFIGVTLVALDWSDHYMINRFPSHELRLQIFLIVAYTIIAMGLAMMLFQRLFFNISNRKIYHSLAHYAEEWERNISSHDFYILFIFSLLALGGIAYTYYYLENLPWMYFLLGMANEAAEARIQASRGFTGVIYIKNVLAIGLTPILCYVAYCYKIQYTEVRFKLLFYALFVGSILILIYNAEKSPILIFFIGFMVLEVLIKGRIKRIYLIFVGGLIFAVVAGMYILLGTDVEAFLSINSGPLGRIFQSQIAGMYVHFYIFPDIYQYLEGAGLPGSIGHLLGFEKQIISARIAMEYFNPGGIENGTAGVINTLFIGEAWANFGWCGVVIAPWIVGVCLDFLYILFIYYLPKHPFFMGLYVYVCFNFPITGGFFGIPFNISVICMMLIISFMYRYRNISWK